MSFWLFVGQSALSPPDSPSLWFDGSDIDGDGSNNAAYADLDPVTTWVDKGSLVTNVTQATSSAKPTYRVGLGPGSLDTISFDGGDFLRSASASPVLTQATMHAAVAKEPGAGTTNRVITDSHSGSSRQVLYYDTAERWTLYAGAGVPATAATNTQHHMLVGIFDGASSEIRKDGVQVVTGNPGAGSLVGLTVGDDVPGASKYTSTIAEILIYDTLPSATEVEAYFEDKYGAFPQ